MLTAFRRAVIAAAIRGAVRVLISPSATPLQFGVTTASDKNCREMAVFSSINGQRSMLHEMFNALMQGEQGRKSIRSE